MSEIEQKIIYALIAKNEKPLVEYSNYTGTFNQICLNYLKKIDSETSKAIKVDNYILFYINEQGITYMIMTGKLYKKESAIGCLQSIQREFTSTFEGRDFDGELNFGLDDEFREKLKLKFNYFNENQDVSDDKLEILKEQLNLMKDEVLEASGLLDERGEKIKVLDEKAEKLSRESYSYYRQSKRVTAYHRWFKIKLYIGLAVGGLIILYFILGLICGFDLSC